MIWEFALTAPDERLIYNPAIARFNVSSIGAGLITTSHQIALETQFLPPKLNDLVFRADKSLTASDCLKFITRVVKLENSLGCTLPIRRVCLEPSV